ncbi:MAG: DUF4126 domain-containing protein [Candidatus Sumerlaeia bacterium]|nr:DUF4126 domain-containing protein [Candidatus Sumerlaeia bacterium]
MDAPTIISTLALTMGAAWCSGMNLYATVAVLALMHRYTGFELPVGMEAVASDIVLWPAIALYVIEFVADKVPAIDTAWDTVHTFIRVPAGVVLAAMAIGEVPVEWQILAGLAGGTLAFGSHATKFTTRVAAHGSGTSPVVSPVASISEDALVVGTLALVWANPWLAILAVILMIIGSAVLVTMLWYALRRVYSFILGRGVEPVAAGPEV